VSSKARTDRWAKRLGILLGVALAGAALLAWRVQGGSGTLGANVRVDAVQTGSVGVAPLSPFIDVSSLLPGHSASGRVRLRNQTGVTLRVRLTPHPSAPDLDGLLRIAIGGGRVLRLAPGEMRSLRVTVSLPAGLRAGYEARIVDVTLQIHSARMR
jgi:hypothetical protein